jgi:hypothetical protein
MQRLEQTFAEITQPTWSEGGPAVDTPVQKPSREPVVSTTLPRLPPPVSQEQKQGKLLLQYDTKWC